MSKGVKAMAYAQLYPEPARRGKGTEKLDLKPNKAYLTQARALLQFPDLTAQVKSGAQSLNDAHAEAARRKAASENEGRAMETLKG